LGPLFVRSFDVSAEQTSALVEVTVETYVEGRGEDAKKVKKARFKLHDKRAALVDLGRYYGLFKDRVEHAGMDGAPLIPEGMTAPISRRCGGESPCGTGTK